MSNGDGRKPDKRERPPGGRPGKPSGNGQRAKGPGSGSGAKGPGSGSGAKGPGSGGGARGPSSGRGPKKPGAGGRSKGPGAGRGARGTGAGRTARPAAERPASSEAGQPEGERLQRILSRAGVASRRKAEELIKARRVTVNGRTAELGQRAGPDDDVRVDGKQLNLSTESVTYLLHKPAGYVTTASDEKGRHTVLDLVPPTPGLHPVGRLDRDSEGLLLLTTDGDLTLRLTHPRYALEKEYRVWCKEGRVDGGALKRLLDGVELDDGPARVLSARPAPGGAVVVLAEGRKREVRRLFKAVDRTVERLVRIRVGDLKLGDLAVGAFRELSAKELSRLGYNPS